MDGCTLDSWRGCGICLVSVEGGIRVGIEIWDSMLGLRESRDFWKVEKSFFIWVHQSGDFQTGDVDLLVEVM